MWRLSARLLAFQLYLFSWSKAVNDESQNPSGVHLMLDFCELFLCCSSSHTHIARLRSTFNILYLETASIIHLTLS